MCCPIFLRSDLKHGVLCEMQVTEIKTFGVNIGANIGLKMLLQNKDGNMRLNIKTINVFGKLAD